MRNLTAFGVLVALCGGTAVRAECAAPSPPPASERPVKPVAPERPRCATTGNCLPGEADRYNAAIGVFNAKAQVYARELQAYVDRLNVYVADAGAYAKCEIAATNGGQAPGEAPPKTPSAAPEI